MLPQHPEVYTIEEIIEKPNPTLAELRLQVPGLRAGHYLCFFGMHVLTPAVFELLDDLVGDNARELGQIQLTTALERAGPERALSRARNPGLAVITSVSSSAWSRPRLHWRWPASTAN